MKKTFPGLFGTLFVFALTAFVVNIAGAQSIVVGTDPTFPPFENLDAAKQIVGFDVDVMKAVAQAAGFTVEFRETSFDRLFGDLAGGRIDAAISCISIIDERRKSMDFSSPYFTSKVVLVTGADENRARRLSDFAGKKVGTQSGVEVWTKALNGIKEAHPTVVYFDDLRFGIDALVRGQIAGFAYDGIYIKYTLLRDPLYQGRLISFEPALADDPLGIAVRKGNTALLSRINSGLKKIHDNGKEKEIEGRWLR